MWVEVQSMKSIWSKHFFLYLLYYRSANDDQNPGISSNKQRKRHKHLILFIPKVHLHLDIPVEFWNFRVVFKQWWSLNARFLFLLSITGTSRRLLQRKYFLCFPLKSLLCFFWSSFLGREKWCLVLPFPWGSLTGPLVFSFGGLSLLHCSQKERATRDALVHEDRPQSEASLPTELHLSLQRSLCPICQATV